MTRTKWMRLVVREPADVLRWASQENARQLDDFRYRVIGGREFVSFRMVPRYTIQVGTGEIVVVACARGRMSRQVLRLSGKTCRRLARGFVASFVWLTAPRARQSAVSPAPGAEVYSLPAPRLRLPLGL